MNEITNAKGENLNLNVNSIKINQLDSEVSQRICTGQVIINLTGACRELIDNALDAGATNIGMEKKKSLFKL